MAKAHENHFTTAHTRTTSLQHTREPLHYSTHENHFTTAHKRTTSLQHTSECVLHLQSTMLQQTPPQQYATSPVKMRLHLWLTVLLDWQPPNENLGVQKARKSVMQCDRPQREGGRGVDEVEASVTKPTCLDHAAFLDQAQHVQDGGIWLVSGVGLTICNHTARRLQAQHTLAHIVGDHSTETSGPPHSGTHSGDSRPY